MRLHLLGSSAGKPVPRPFCSCRVCCAALRDGGKEMRTRTGLQFYPRGTAQTEFLRPTYQVDISPDYVHQIIRDRIDPSGLQHLLVTHPDADHLHLDYLKFRSSIRSPMDALPILHIYGNSLVEAAIRSEISNLEAIRCQFHTVNDGETFPVGEVMATAFVATHRGPRCLHYAVDDGRHKVLFAWDGTWEEEVWARLSRRRFDAIGMECVHLGPGGHPSRDHVMLDHFLEIKERLLREEILADGGRLFAVHIGDNGGLTYAEAQAHEAEWGFTVGYDGMIVDLDL